MEYVVKIGNLAHFTFWILAISGHLYITDLLRGGEHSDGKLCFNTDVDPKALAAFLGLAILLQTWAFMKLVANLFFGISFPALGCGTKVAPRPSIARGRGVAVSGAIVMLVLAIGGLNLAVYTILIMRLMKASKNADGFACISLSKTDYQFLRIFIYLAWSVLILSGAYSSWNELYCNRPL